MCAHRLRIAPQQIDVHARARAGYAARPYLGEAPPFPYPLPPYSKFPRPLSPPPLASGMVPGFWSVAVFCSLLS